MRNKLCYLVYSAGLAVAAAGMVLAADPPRGGGANPGGGRGAAVQGGVEPGPAAPAVPTGERSFTKPSEEIDLAFSAPGLITAVNVKDNEPVKKGQVLAEQDVTVEKANKATYEIEANSTVEEEYAIADLEVKKVELKRKEKLFNDKKAINQLEVDEARLNVKRAEASVKLAQQKRQTAAAQAAVEQAKIELKRIISPIDGMVKKLDTHPGEVASNQVERPAIQIVKNDPLWIDVNFPAGTAAKLKHGQTVQVRYRDPNPFVTEQNKWMNADVLSLQPVVRSGSQTRTVRLVMANPDDVPPGLEVDVRLPDPSVAAANGQAPQP